MKSHDLNHWNINLPVKSGETFIEIPVSPGSRLAIIRASEAPFYLGETNSFGDTRINSIDKKNFSYEIKQGRHLFIGKNDSYERINIEIDFI